MDNFLVLIITLIKYEIISFQFIINLFNFILDFKIIFLNLLNTGKKKPENCHITIDDLESSGGCFHCLLEKNILAAEIIHEKD